jgi:hypothetical protein
MENILIPLPFHSQKLKSINLVQYVVVMEIAHIIQETWILAHVKLGTQVHLVTNGVALELLAHQIPFAHQTENVMHQTHALVIPVIEAVLLVIIVNIQCAMEKVVVIHLYAHLMVHALLDLVILQTFFTIVIAHKNMEEMIANILNALEN